MLAVAGYVAQYEAVEAFDALPADRRQGVTPPGGETVDMIRRHRARLVHEKIG